jgi:hypothetical protein
MLALVASGPVKPPGSDRVDQDVDGNVVLGGDDLQPTPCTF